MKQIPIHDPDVQKVVRIARDLCIDLNEAALTCDAFELAFSDYILRCRIFDMMDELDDDAVAKGEPEGLIISYAVDLGPEGIKVTRYADQIPEGESIAALPPETARVYCRVSENFPTTKWLGPLIINRPQRQPDNSLAELSTMAGLSPSEKLRMVICERHFQSTFEQSFPIVPISVVGYQDGNAVESVSTRDPGKPLADLAASHVKEFTSGLSPPRNSENAGTPE